MEQKKRKSFSRSLREFFYDVVLSDNAVSIKRFIVLIMTLFLILSSLIGLVLLPVVLFTTTKGDLELVKALSIIFQDITEKSFWIVLAGTGLISAVDVAAIMKSKVTAGVVDQSSVLGDNIFSNSGSKPDTPYVEGNGIGITDNKTIDVDDADNLKITSVDDEIEKDDK